MFETLMFIKITESLNFIIRDHTERFLRNASPLTVVIIFLHPSVSMKFHVTVVVTFKKLSN